MTNRPEQTLIGRVLPETPTYFPYLQVCICDELFEETIETLDAACGFGVRCSGDLAEELWRE